jgi:hypothetical protein
MRTSKRPARIGAVVVSALLLSLTAGPALAAAQSTPPAPDGQLFQSQSQQTQRLFQATYGGGSCAAQEWTWQHSLAIGSAIADGPAASDGQKMTDQDDAVQLMFVALFGPQASAEWLAEHNAFVGHHVLPASVAPIPCPAAAKSGPAEVIGTSHLAKAVDAARTGDLVGAYGNFAGFRTIWNATKGDVRKRSPGLADRVQAAFDPVNALLSDPRAPAPAQSQYFPALQNLQEVVQAANAELGR